MPTDTPSERPTGRARDHRLWLLAAVLLAAVMQIILVIRSPVISTDGVVFIDMARAMKDACTATIRTADQHPGYPVMILAGWTLLRPFMDADAVETWVVAGRLASGVCGLLCVLVAWLLGRRVFDRRIATVSAAIMAVLPLFRENAADALSDSPHLLFYLLAVWLAAEGLVRKKPLWFALSGAACGFAYWIRPEALAVVLVTGVLVVLWGLCRGQGRSAVLSFAVLVLAVVIIGAPYALAKGQITGKKSLSQLLGFEGRKQRFVSIPAASAPARTEQARTAPTKPARAPEAGVVKGNRPGESPKAEEPRPALKRKHRRPKPKPRNVIVALGDELAHGLRYFLLLPLAVGLLVPRVRKAQREPRILISAVVLLHLVLLVLLYLKFKYLSGRHTMTLSSLLMPWLASGMVAIAATVSRLLSRGAAWFTPDRVLLVMVAATVICLFPRGVRPMHHRRIPLMKAARWIREQAREGDAVMSNSEYACFYSELPGVLLVSKDRMARVLAAHPEQNLRFVLLDSGAKSYSKRWHLRLRKRYGYERVRVPGVTGDGSRIKMLMKREE